MTTRFASLAVAALALVAATGAPEVAGAREVKLTTTMANFPGVGAYVIYYLTDAEGHYQRTLWVAGRSARYYGGFRHWWRATEVVSKQRLHEVDGITGASLSHNEVFTLSVDLADELIDAGYLVKIDSTNFEGREYPSDVVAPLSSEVSGKPIDGRGYIESLIIDM